MVHHTMAWRSREGCDDCRSATCEFAIATEISGERLREQNDPALEQRSDAPATGTHAVVVT